MKRTTFAKFLSIFLMVAFIFSCIPLAALAATPEGASSETNLTESATSNSNYTEIINTKVTELTALRTETSKHFKLTDGTYQAVYYGVPVHRKDANGMWQDIDNSLYLVSKNGSSTLKTHDNRAVFSKEFAFGEPVFSLNENGYSISMSLVGDGNIVASNIEKLDATDNVYLKTQSIVTNSIARDSSDGWKTIEEASRIDNETSVMYSNIMPNVDLEYVLVNNKVKENIILNKPQNSYTFEFSLATNGLYAKLDGNGSIIFYDSATNTSRYTIPAPYMYDGNGELSYNVSYSLSTDVAGVYDLTVTADSEWINSSDRSWPITIDPTLAPDYAVYDAYVTSSSPSTNYGMTTYMQINSTSTALIYIDLYDLPEGATVTSAYLDVPFYHTNASQSSYTSVNAYRILETWDETSVKYNTMPALRTSYSANSYFVASSSNSASSPGETSFYIKSEVVDWLANPNSNFGLAFKYQSGNTTLRFLAYESGSHYASISVNYSYVIDDGIYAFKSDYYLNNWLTTGTTNGTPYIKNTTSTTSPVNSSDRTQLFKVTHVSGDRYIIRSMSNNMLSFGISGSSVVVKTIEGEDDIVANVDNVCIEWDGVGFMLRPYGSQRCVSVASTSQLSTASATNTTSRARWTFVKCTNFTGNDPTYGISVDDIYISGGTVKFQPNNWTSVLGANQPVMNAQASDASAIIQSWNAATNTYTITFRRACNVVLTLAYNDLEVKTYDIEVRNLADGNHYVRSLVNNKYLQLDDGAGNAPLVLDILTGEEYQVWTFEYIANGYYKITSPHNGLALSVQSGSTNEISEIVLAEYTGASTQQWKISPSGRKTLTPRSSETSSGNWYLVASTVDANAERYSICQSNNTSSTENEWFIIPQISASGSALTYDSSYWNELSNNVNCYAYAVNNPNSNAFTCIPGGLSGEIVNDTLDEINGYRHDDYIDAIVEAIKADYMVKFNLSSEEALYNYFREVEYDEVCPEGMYKIALGSYVEDGIAYFHFYRQDASGFWSHKNGTIPVTNVDENGSLLPNPLCINDYYGVYGYYMVVPWVSESEMALYDTLENTYEEPLISCSLIKTAVLSFSKQRDE